MVHPEGGSSSTVSRSNWNLMLVFKDREKPEYTEKNLSEQGQEPTTKLNPQLKMSLVIKPMPHWWEASALSTVPSLLPMVKPWL